MIEEGSIHATISQKDGKIFRALKQACSEVYFEADNLILDIRHYAYHTVYQSSEPGIKELHLLS